MEIFETVKVAGIPLLVIVLGLVQYIKGFGVEGNLVKILSMIVGWGLGIGYQLSIAVPVNFAGWFSACVFGIGLGLVASGLYDVAKK